MVVPHFGEYIAFKLDPVASLKYLKDLEVTKACEALKSKVYVACVTHPNRFILPDMAVPITPNDTNPLSRPLLNPTLPLPWPDCYHPTLTMMHCRVRNDLTIGDPWSDPKYQLKHEDRLLEIYHFQDAARRDTLQKEQEALCVSDAAGDVSDNQIDERQASTAILPLPSEHDADLESYGTLPIVSKGSFKLSSFLCPLRGKVLRWVPCLRPNLDRYNRDFSDDPLQGFNLFGAIPPDTMPVIEAIDNIDSVKQVNDPWDFFRELDALKRIEADYQERMEVKVQADIERARQKDEALHARLESRMPKHEPSPTETIAISVSMMEASLVTLPPPFEQDVESQYRQSLSEAASQVSRSACKVESQGSCLTGDAQSQHPGSVNEASQACATTFLRSVLSKLLPCIPWLRVDIYDHDEVALISPSNPIWSHPVFGVRPPDTMPIVVLLDDIEAIKPEQIDDPWDFFLELETLKRIEEDYNERVKAKTQAAIDRAHQRDEELNARLQSKMPQRVSPPAATVTPPFVSGSQDPKSSADA
ncbi:uncharacterized protein BT62DRAFT_1071146 [Guyanagaster necrorhizus]|uniref:Uncharacterized protein n=1 Tax=Guyanagaster necrorhizus TaxID=856835 RepID=A0A9P7W3L1_9AGAR|nr:uncharacterized protein BT62DRAFT_1071146 [Guyanagaster necrorhizus MCA 3950]KAG7451944.1 hypothetical protein BT62DRAFT_1071146 [Guyanagaster necrorhizus MCA 3950]